MTYEQIMIDQESEMNKQKLENDLNEFTKSFVEALIWSSVDMDKGDYIECDWENFNHGLQCRIKIECLEFLQMAETYLAGWTMEQAGHDFALTRNRHGAGFWDRYSEGKQFHDDGEQLTELSHKFGEMNLYFGDDGKVYA